MVWAYDVGKHVKEGEKCMVLYLFLRDKYNLPGIKHVMNAICVIRDIDQARDTVMHNSLVAGKEKKRVLSDISRRRRRLPSWLGR